MDRCAGAGEEDDFHLIPSSLAGRMGLVLIAVGFFSFLGGIISAAACGLPAATKLAVGGMIVLFVGGVLRVYSQ